MSDETKTPIDIYDLITLFTDQAAGVAWTKLGLQPDPLTQEFGVDPDQAKVAIDLVSHLGTVLEPRLEEADRRELNNLVASLRLNYVQKTKS